MCMANNSFGRFSCKRVRDNLATKQQQQGGLKKSGITSYFCSFCFSRSELGPWVIYFLNNNLRIILMLLFYNSTLDVMNYG